jgi:hypothetical protein
MVRSQLFLGSARCGEWCQNVQHAISLDADVGALWAPAAFWDCGAGSMRLGCSHPGRDKKTELAAQRRQFEFHKDKYVGVRQRRHREDGKENGEREREKLSGTQAADHLGSDVRPETGRS